jgi:hypothetical protein
MRSRTTNTRKERKEDKTDHKKGKKNLGEAHIENEWDSNVESSSEEDEKIAIITINKPSSPSKLFTNLPDDDYYSPHIFKAKGEKVNPKSKAKAPPPPPPSDISSSDLSDSSSDDKSSDVVHILLKFRAIAP